MKRKHPYRCRICGCYLDPGEGRICSDCLEAERGKREMRTTDVLPAAFRLPTSYTEIGECPYCGQSYEFETIGPAPEEIRQKWAIQKCDCIDARLHRMAEAEERREMRRRQQGYDTY